jgi:hypothetical protein
MTWQQIVIAICMILSLSVAMFKSGRDRSMSSGVACLSIMISIAYGIGYSLVLHAGGFW